MPSICRAMARVSAIGACLTGVFGHLSATSARFRNFGDRRAQFVSEIGTKLALAFKGLFQTRQEIIEPASDGRQLDPQPVRGEAGGKRLGADLGGSLVGELVERGQLPPQDPGDDKPHRDEQRQAASQQYQCEDGQGAVQFTPIGGDDEDDIANRRSGVDFFLAGYLRGELETDGAAGEADGAGRFQNAGSASVPKRRGAGSNPPVTPSASRTAPRLSHILEKVGGDPLSEPAHKAIGKIHVDVTVFLLGGGGDGQGLGVEGGVEFLQQGGARGEPDRPARPRRVA